MNSKTRMILIGLLVLFIAVRVPGLSVPYQQDEFKTAIATETSLSAASTFLTHPPLTALLYRADALVFGGENMRLMPLLFGLISAILLFLVVRKRFDERTALWSVFLYSISFYGIWASLMLDTDGAILPTLFLAAIYCYDRAMSDSKKLKRWIFLLILVLITGLLVKLSFILVVGVLIADFLFEKRKELTVAHIAYIGVAGVAFAILTGVAFIIVKFLNPAFTIDGMITHVMYYVHSSGRNYLQIIVEGIKAVFYLSPLLIAPLVFISKDVIKRTSPFIWYLALGFVFYFVLFDFSHGALDKYLMFTIVPLCVISGDILSKLFTSFSLRDNSRYIVAGTILLVALIALSFTSPEVVPLYPKTEWFSRVIHWNWNMLLAFNGGSGPVGFYVSFLVIVCSFILSGIFAFAGRIRKSLLGLTAILIVCTGIAYNATFIEEFSFGKIYGNTAEALNPALAYIATSNDIKSITTYNDIGAYELKHMGKYTGRFYAAPQFESIQSESFPENGRSFLVVNIPPLYDGFYTDFFNSCNILFTARSGVITSTVYSSCTWTKE